MGNTNTINSDQQTTPRLNHSGSLAQIDTISHPKLAHGKIVLDNDHPSGGYILLPLSIPSKTTYQQWQQRIKKYVPKDSQLCLMLPKQFKFKEHGFCGSAGTLQVKYDLYPIMLADQLQNRRQNQKYFQQPQLWYLMYTYIQSASILHKKGNILGDVRPQTAFINKGGQVMLGNQCTFLQQQKNYEKTKLNRQITYLAPQVIKQLQEGGQPKSNLIIAQSFSIGLTLLDALLLSDSNDLYTTQLNFRSRKLLQRVKSLSQADVQNEMLLGIIASLCHPDPIKRLTVQQVYSVLKPYQDDILNLSQFIIQNVDEYLQNKILSTLKKYYRLNINQNLKSSQSNYSWKDSQHSKQQQNQNLKEKNKNKVYIDHGQSRSKSQRQNVDRKQNLQLHNKINSDSINRKSESPVNKQQTSPNLEKKLFENKILNGVSSQINLNFIDKNNVNTIQNTRGVPISGQKIMQTQSQFYHQPNQQHQQQNYQYPMQSFNNYMSQFSPNKTIQNAQMPNPGHYPPPSNYYYHPYQQYPQYYQYSNNHPHPSQLPYIYQQYPYKPNSNNTYYQKINYPPHPSYVYPSDSNFKPISMAHHPNYQTDSRKNIQIRHVYNSNQNSYSEKETNKNINTTNNTNNQIRQTTLNIQNQLNQKDNPTTAKNSYAYSTGQQNYSSGRPQSKSSTYKKSQSYINQNAQMSEGSAKRQPVALNNKGSQKYLPSPIKNKQMLYSFENTQKQSVQQNSKNSIPKIQHKQGMLNQMGRPTTSINPVGQRGSIERSYTQKYAENEQKINQYNKAIQDVSDKISNSRKKFPDQQK